MTASPHVLDPAQIKFVVVEGQRFPVLKTHSNADLRAVLALNYPMVSEATIEIGTEDVNGTTFERVEFVKVSGRKSALDVPLLLQRTPQASRPKEDLGLILYAMRGRLSVDEVVQANLDDMILEVEDTGRGETLCQHIAKLQPTLGGDLPHGW